ncbi:MAG: hypothetical protein GEV05_28540 [Betaproteobacteria bacterium]|nr:hypothetical protein [Betaproteobacteria bacterium]
MLRIYGNLSLLEMTPVLLAADIETVRAAWPYLHYPGTLAADLLDVFERQEPWIARTQKRAPRTREALAGLIDDSVVREARAG